MSELPAGSEENAKTISKTVPRSSYGKGPDGWIARVPTYMGERPTANSINDLRRDGRAIGYQLIDKYGKTDPRKSFDLAVFWKDYIDYDKLSLEYDTFDPSGELTTTIFLQIPQVSTSWEVKYKHDLETNYNGELQAKNELLEILPEED
jgi:hypothetical protein